MQGDWITEFNRSYELTLIAETLARFGFQDASWRHDICPRFRYQVGEHCIDIWIDHPDESESGLGKGTGKTYYRFSVGYRPEGMNCGMYEQYFRYINFWEAFEKAVALKGRIPEIDWSKCSTCGKEIATECECVHVDPEDPEDCPDCGGTGVDPFVRESDTWPCKTCKGEGIAE